MAKVTPKKVSISFNILTLIPSIVKLIELQRHGAPGAEKKEAAKEAAIALMAAAGQAVAANNPSHQKELDAIIDATVGGLNKSGQMPTPAPQP